MGFVQKFVGYGNPLVHVADDAQSKRQKELFAFRGAFGVGHSKSRVFSSYIALGSVLGFIL